MNAQRSILVLYPSGAPAKELEAMAGALRAEGARVLLRETSGDYDAMLDEIAAADSVVCWK